MSVAITAAEPQHLHALARANEIRLARASTKRAIASGEVLVADVLLDCPAEIQRMEIGELISCQRRWGGQRTRRLLSTVPVVETKLVGALTERQRRAIADALTGLQSNLTVV
ncbi:MAG: hypothetical protein JHD16_03945 [Solirubrobacteraceae bacterium]|nr:hypothetical protein [Solirubrobacteraceae bacterium]